MGTGDPWMSPWAPWGKGGIKLDCVDRFVFCIPPTSFQKIWSPSSRNDNNILGWPPSQVLRMIHRICANSGAYDVYGGPWSPTILCLQGLVIAALTCLFCVKLPSWASSYRSLAPVSSGSYLIVWGQHAFAIILFDLCAHLTVRRHPFCNCSLSSWSTIV